MTALSARPGEAPEVIGPAPHGQRSQTAPILIQEELWGRMRSLPYVYAAPTLVSVPLGAEPLPAGRHRFRQSSSISVWP
jgi:phospholipase/carboxylesterase